MKQGKKKKTDLSKISFLLDLEVSLEKIRDVAKAKLNCQDFCLHITSFFSSPNCPVLHTAPSQEIVTGFQE